MFSIFSFSQEKDKYNTVFLKVGSTIDYDNYSDSAKLVSKGISLEASYQRKIVNQFTIEGFYNFSQISNLPNWLNKSGFRNDSMIDGYFNVTNFFLDSYEYQRNHFLGINLHYSFINNYKWYASFFAGAGYVYYDLEQVIIRRISGNEFGGVSVSEWNRVRDSGFEFFTKFGFQLNYTYKYNYVFGIEPSWIFISSNEELFLAGTPEPIDGFLNLSLNFGYRF